MKAFKLWKGRGILFISLKSCVPQVGILAMGLWKEEAFPQWVTIWLVLALQSHQVPVTNLERHWTLPLAFPHIAWQVQKSGESSYSIWHIMLELVD